jgi:hypothetical protein
MKTKKLKIFMILFLIFSYFWFYSFAEVWTWSGTWEVLETWQDQNLPQIMIDPDTNSIYITWYIGSWDQIDTWEVLEAIITDEIININTDPIDVETEFADALAWMYANWLTKYNNKDDYKMYDLVTRQEASKIIWQAYNALWYTDITKNSSCDFSDSAMFDSTLAPHIANVCKWWLFKWSNGKYLPYDNLTKAEAMAVLLRMFEWKMSYELQIPWRENYYTKGKLIWLTNIEDINKFDKNLTRYEIGLMVYRLKNIATNQQLKTMALNLLWQVKNNNTTWTMDSNTITENLNTLIWWIDPYKDPELLEAIYWMFDNWLTIHNNPSEYRPFDTLNKAAAAKIFDKFSTMLGMSSNEAFLQNQCEFTDISSLDSATQQHIINVCRKWIIKGNNNLFYPGTELNKSHFVVSLIRMFQWKDLDEDVDPRWQNYFNEAKDLGLVSPWDVITFENNISRYEVALFLYKFNIKYKMLNNLNNSRITDEIISTVPGSISTWTNWKQKSNVYLDSNLLKKWSFDIWYVETFWTRYKIVKSSESTYFTENFVWYGDVFDLATDEKLGTINFVVSNGYVVESTIRFEWENNYKIIPVEWTSAYYLIEEL